MGFFDFFRGAQPPLVQQALRDVQQMLDVGQRMFFASTAALLDNEILEVDLKLLDKDVNRCEQDLRRVVLEHLTVAPDRELVFSLKLISIVQEAERIGDLCKSLGRNVDMAARPRSGPFVTRLRALRDRIGGMFDDTRAGFVESDERRAVALMAIHEQNKADVAGILRDLAASTTITVNEGVIFALTAQMLSRISSHLANIASAVTGSFEQLRRGGESLRGAA